MFGEADTGATQEVQNFILAATVASVGFTYLFFTFFCKSGSYRRPFFGPVILS